MKGILISLCVALATIVAPAGAGATHKTQAPGDSAIDQYVPDVPAADGDRTIGNGSQEGESVLPAQVAAELRRQGAAGVAVESLVDATARRNTGRGANGKPSAGPPSGGSGIVSNAIGGAGGMGVVLPIVLVVTLVGMAAALAIRRRSRGTESE